MPPQPREGMTCESHVVAKCVCAGRDSRRSPHYRQVLALDTIGVVRRMVIGGLVALACLASAWAAVVYVLDRDRQSAESELAQDRLQTLTSAAQALGTDLAAIGLDLNLAGALATDASSSDSAEHELRAIVAVKRDYVAIQTQRDDGETLRVVGNGVPASVLALAEPVITSMIATARQTPGELHISSGLSSNDDVGAWYRVFASRVPNGAITVAFVIDMRLLVSPPSVLRVGPSRLLVLSAHGVPAPASDIAMTGAVHDEGPSGPLHVLLKGARDRHPSTSILDASLSRQLGLPDSTSVAAAVPIPIDAGAPWVLMLATSTASLDARHQALVRRIAIELAIGLLLVVVVAAYVVRNARRSAVLREKLRHAEVLAHLTEKAEKILDHVPSSVLALDQHGIVTACNRSFGGRRDAIIGRSLVDAFEDAPPDHVRIVSELVAAATTGGAPRTLRRARLALSGPEAYVTIHAIPLANAFRDVATLLVIDDESAVQRAEDRLLRSEKLATAGQLAAGIAHEIGTPLGVARGRAEMILLRGIADEADTRNLRIITDRIDHVSRLIELLLDYLRPHVAQVRRVDASDSLHLVANLLAPQASSREVRLEIGTVAEAADLRADPDQLQQVLVNLVMNAIDACEPGGHVVLSVRPRDHAIVLEVVDDGRGIAPEDRAHVFDPFFTTKKRGQGTGLGLWVVAQVARAHDAEIEVDSQLGHGSTFRLVWPAAGSAA